MVTEPENQDVCFCRIIHQERITAARSHALAEGEQSRLCDLFKAMGDNSRLKILQALGREEMCVCDLACFLGVSESAVSHQLRLLRQLNLVKHRRTGPILYYRVHDQHIEQLLAIGLEHIRE